MTLCFHKMCDINSVEIRGWLDFYMVKFFNGMVDKVVLGQERCT